MQNKKTMSIWFREYKLEDLQWMMKENMCEAIGIEITELTPESIKGKMPVDHRTVQPMKILHGGASVALAETLGSVGAAMVIDPDKCICVGQEINANHIRGVRGGLVTGIAVPVHLGNSSHVWEIKIYDEAEKLVCISRLTVAILAKR